MDAPQLVEMYRLMVLIRAADDRLEDLLKRGEITDHYPCAGQEATAVGACTALRAQDLITSHYRGLGHLLARGADLRRVLAEYMGKETGYCKGKGGPKHVAAFELGVCGAYSIVGAGIPIAAGLALACKFRKTGQVVACFFGDGGSNQGTFHEGLNLAAVLRLPVIFVCENNLYAQTTRVSYSVPIEHIAARGAAYGIPGTVVDGMDLLAVHEAVGTAAAAARDGGGPRLVECKTYRYKGHFAAETFIKFQYRSDAEVEEWRRKDPIAQFGRLLRDRAVLTDRDAETIWARAVQAVDDAVTYARQSPLPAETEALRDVFATEGVLSAGGW